MFEWNSVSGSLKDTPVAPTCHWSAFYAAGRVRDNIVFWEILTKITILWNFHTYKRKATKSKFIKFIQATESSALKNVLTQRGNFNFNVLWLNCKNVRTVCCMKPQVELLPQHRTLKHNPAIKNPSFIKFQYSVPSVHHLWHSVSDLQL